MGGGRPNPVLGLLFLRCAEKCLAEAEARIGPVDRSSPMGSTSAGKLVSAAPSSSPLERRASSPPPPGIHALGSGRDATAGDGSAIFQMIGSGGSGRRACGTRRADAGNIQARLSEWGTKVHPGVVDQGALHAHQWVI
jgi:hypothetical protein